MTPKIVSEWHAVEIKRQALEKRLLQQYEDELSKADAKERKRIEKRIEKQIHEALKEDFEKASGQKPWIR